MCQKPLLYLHKTLCMVVLISSGACTLTQHLSAILSFLRVMGNRNSTYEKALRDVRPFSEHVAEALFILQFRIDNENMTVEEKIQVSKICTNCKDKMGSTLDDNKVTMPAKDRQSIRIIKQRIALIIEALDHLDMLEPTTSIYRRNVSATVGDLLSHLNQFIRWMDETLEKKWWLSEAVKYSRILLKTFTLVSAVLSVIFPAIAGPIATLSFTAANVVVDVIDKTIVQGLRPEQVLPRSRATVSPLNPSRLSIVA